MGSDGPDKQELEAELVAAADRLIADSIAQCIRQGELHHAIEAGLIRQYDIDGELGQVVSGDIGGRLKDSDITICDLTGVGVQDAAIAGLVYRRIT